MPSRIAPFTALEVSAKVVDELTAKLIVSDVDVRVDGASVTIRIAPTRTEGASEALNYALLPGRHRELWTEYVRARVASTRSQIEDMRAAIEKGRAFTAGR